MNGYRPIPLNRAGGESYDNGQVMTMQEAQRIAAQYGHVPSRISSGAIDPNNPNPTGVWGVPTEGGWIPVEQLGGAPQSDSWRGAPQQRAQGAPPLAGQSGPIIDTINKWQSNGTPGVPANTPSVASTAQTPARQGAVAAYGERQQQQQVIWPAPPGMLDSPQYQPSGYQGAPAQMAQQQAGPQRMDGPRYQFPQIGQRPMREIIGATPPVMQNPPPSMASTPERTAQSRHYQFDPGFYGGQQPDPNNPRFGTPPNLWNSINGAMPWSR